MRPQERIYEWKWNDVSDTGRSLDNDNMANVVSPDNIHTHTHTHIDCTFLMVVKYYKITK